MILRKEIASLAQGRRGRRNTGETNREQTPLRKEGKGQGFIGIGGRKGVLYEGSNDPRKMVLGGVPYRRPSREKCSTESCRRSSLKGTNKEATLGLG